MHHDGDTTPVQTTQTSLDIVELVQKLDGARLADVKSELDLAKSTAYKHLLTLRENGYLVKEGDTYHIGLKFLNLGEFVRSQWPLETINDAVMSLSDETGEEVDFLTEDCGRVMTIDKSYRKYHNMVRYGEDDSSGERQKAPGQLGNYYHMHVTGAGKAILAEYPDSRVERIVDRWGLPAKTDNTILTKSDLFEELEQIRDQGYAVNDEEYANGLRSVAKVVLNPRGGVFGALNVAGPSYRMNGVVLESEIPLALEDATSELEASIEEQSAFLAGRSGEGH